MNRTLEDPAGAPADRLARAEGLLEARRLDQALAEFDAAERAGGDPSRAAGGRWVAWMLLGDFERAWHESDAIARRRAAESAPMPGSAAPSDLAQASETAAASASEPVLDPGPVWDGTPLAGRHVLVRCWHGLGDAVQFLRYVPRLKALGCHVSVDLPPPLLSLMRGQLGIDLAYTSWQGFGMPDPPHDVAIEVMELPCAQRTTLETLAADTAPVPYLTADPERVARVRETFAGGKGFKVGVAWACHAWNPARSLTLEALAPLAANPGARLFSLQGQPEVAKLSNFEDFEIADNTELTGDVADLAAAIACMDYVVSVDTLVAHLAGALGRPGSVLLLHAADWRWMHGARARGDESPWYPTLRLNRQPRPGEWAPAIAAAARAVAEAAHIGGGTRAGASPECR